MPIAPRGSRKAMRGKCERGQGSANVDGAGAEVFADDGYSQKASFGPMAAISRRGQGGRIYNNTRTREPLRRKCVKPADRTTHSPPKTCSRPSTATRPSRALPLPPAAPTHARRLRDARPPTAQLTPRSATLPPLPFRFGHKKTAPHSACAMPNVSVDRRCGRSFGLVSRALFAAVAGRWRVGVGLRPQPWALRSRRCGRVLRA